MELARKSLNRLLPAEPEKEHRVTTTLAYIDYVTKLEKAEGPEVGFLDCFKGTNLRRTEIVSFDIFSLSCLVSLTGSQNCVVWAAQILCGNAILGFSVVFLESAGFSAEAAFDVNIALSACYIVGGVICWFLMPRFGRATIYMAGLAFMFCCLVIIGGLGFSSSHGAKVGIAVLFVISTLANMISVGPACYPIVAETPSGQLRYKTITIGRFVYNLTGIFQNSVTPRMVSPLSEYCSSVRLAVANTSS